MRLSASLLAAGLAFTALVPPAQSSDVGGLCSGSFGLSDGQWASYATDAPFMNEKVETRHAIVGTEAGSYWLEFEAAMPMGNGAMIVKLLIPGWPYARDAVKRAQMQMPRVEGMDPLPPIEMPPSSAQSDNLSDPVLMACAEQDKGTMESVTVAAGTFNATRVPVRKLGKDVWLSAEVPFGLVKMADDEDKGVELTAFGTGAEAAITEEAQIIPGMEQ